MPGYQDVEYGEKYKAKDVADTEQESLLPNFTKSDSPVETRPISPATKPRFSISHLTFAFLGGALACCLAQYAIRGTNLFSSRNSNTSSNSVHILAPPYVGSSESHIYPPTSPTNAFPTLFPSDVGYPGGTPTGAEPALIITAPSYPVHTGAAQLVAPASLGNTTGHHKFDIFKKWGNLSPWYSVDKTAFGLNSGPEAPDTCRVTGLHLLHRHGARYPTAWASYGGPTQFAARIHKTAANWNASGDLDFLNEWTYKLGEEVLTPFGRQQLYDLGVSMRLKYGFLLKNFTETDTIPVFRTESQDRMWSSAMNFALGFFGYPLEGKYQQSITIEATGFNNTLAPYTTCTNAYNSRGNRAAPFVQKWASIYLKKALARLRPQLKGYDLTTEDVYALQQMCAYETVALGYSKFCELFTKEEWDGFNYSFDINFWYGSAFGSPIARAQGIGYVQELVARLTHTPIETHNSTTNSTLDDSPVTFPLGQSLYVDATHEVVVLNVITALNLSNFAASGTLPTDHIPRRRSFVVSDLAPFATNVQFQLLECTSVPGPQIRIIINDGVVPLTGIKGCPRQRDGMCPVDKFVAAQKKIIGETDWEYDCLGEWDIPDGWETTTGDSPK